MKPHAGPQVAVIGVSCPGGMARQFRVQVASQETACRWRMVGSFRDDEAASRCADRWRDAGASARVVICRALPTAA
jgi:hypothetical protein